jgi:hypothetical protein
MTGKSSLQSGEYELDIDSGSTLIFDSVRDKGYYYVLKRDGKQSALLTKDELDLEDTAFLELVIDIQKR